MILKPYLHQISNIILIAFIAMLGVFTFNEELIFDLIYTFLIAFCLVLVFENNDLRGTVIILFVSDLVLEAVFWLTDFIPLLPFKIALYLALLIAFVKFKQDSLRIPILIVTALGISAETYWFLISYDSPAIYWPLSTILIAQLTQTAISLRPFVRITFFSKKIEIGTKHSSFDWEIIKLLNVSIILESLQVIEYLMRHVANLNILFMYHSHPYLIRIFNLAILYFIMSHSAKLVLSKKLVA
jgi:hypothetical protein